MFKLVLEVLRTRHRLNILRFIGLNELLARVPRTWKLSLSRYIHFFLFIMLIKDLFCKSQIEICGLYWRWLGCVVRSGMPVYDWIWAVRCRSTVLLYLSRLEDRDNLIETRGYETYLWRDWGAHWIEKYLRGRLY